MALAALVPEPVTAQLTLLAPVVLTARVTVKVKALLPLFPSVWLALVAAIAKVGTATSSFWIVPTAVEELRFMLNILQENNGQFIFSSITLSKVESLASVKNKVMQIQESEEDIDDLYVSDASDTHAFVYKADGSFEFVKDYEFEQSEQNLGSGHRELLAIKKALSLDAEQFRKMTATKLYWQTDSRNCFNFLTRGSRRQKIQRDVFAIKKLEKELNVIVIPVWTPGEHVRLVLADLGSKFSNSTDEWAIDRSQLMEIFKKLNFWPTVDAFASQHNKICRTFYSLLLQTGSAGVNFFAQTLNSNDVYFCCPPSQTNCTMF